MLGLSLRLTRLPFAHAHARPMSVVHCTRTGSFKLPTPAFQTTGFFTRSVNSPTLSHLNAPQFRTLSLSSRPRSTPFFSSAPRYPRTSSLLAQIRLFATRTAWRRHPPRNNGAGNNGGGNIPFLERIPHNRIVWGIIAINVAVFGLWKWAEVEARAGNFGPLRYMYETFTTSSTNFAAARYYTLITSAFSQKDIWHALFNGLTFYWMAPAVLQLLGATRFLALYLGGALACSGATLVTDDSRRPSLGASGAVYAIISTFACAFPRTTFLLYGILPVPAWACIAGILAWDGYNALSEYGKPAKPGSSTGYVGHVAGILTGMAYFFLRVRGRRF